MQGKSKMNLKKFKEKYLSLNHNHRNIVWGTLRRMKHSTKHNKINYAIHNRIKQERKALGIGYEELYRRLSHSLNNSVPKKTYDSYMLRKSINGDLLIHICKILNISTAEIDKIKKSILIQSSDATEIDWLYNSLSPQDQAAICYLASALYMDEHFPEVFNDNTE